MSNRSSQAKEYVSVEQSANSEITSLKEQIAVMCREHAETIAEVNQDKEMLIQQNSQLKTAATEQLTQNE